MPSPTKNLPQAAPRTTPAYLIFYSNAGGERLHGWESAWFQAMNHGAARTEWLWCNFRETIALHDYRYLGTGFASVSALTARSSDGRPAYTACRCWSVTPCLPPFAEA